MYNKRIQELAEQAGYKHPDAVGKCEDYAYFDHEKFAELIVRECIEVVVDCSIEYVTRPQIMKEIKEHFGVKE